jgi:large subunit ribosomal protein L22
MVFHYSMKDVDEKKTAKAAGVSLDMSFKHAKMVCNLIRGMNAEEAVELLEGIISLKIAVPYTEYFRDLSHKTAVGPARFPVKTTKAMLTVLKSAIANAQHKGLATSELIIKQIAAHTAAKPWHAGRHARRKMKRAHLELVLEQVGEAKAEKKEGKKAAVKTEQKKEKPAKAKPARSEDKNPEGAN